MSTHTWRNDLEVLRASLTDTQQHRDERMAFITLPDGTSELGWVLHEREQMLVAVNRLRSAAGKPAASMEEVLAAERSACGHVDYTAKFAMGCADLVAG